MEAFVRLQMILELDGSDLKSNYARAGCFHPPAWPQALFLPRGISTGPEVTAARVRVLNALFHFIHGISPDLEMLRESTWFQCLVL